MTDFRRTPEHFWSKVARSGDCWVWTGRRSVDGYGRYGTSSTGAHRVAYMLSVGPLEPGTPLDHLCHTRDVMCPGGPTCNHRRCVNPDHLEPVTPGENTRRGRGLAAQNAAKTHCKRGHLLSGSNVRIYVYPGNHQRHCLACRALRRLERAS